VFFPSRIARAVIHSARSCVTKSVKVA
jgi:hypothetical protein